MYACAGDAHLSGCIACSAVAGVDLTLLHLGHMQRVHSHKHVAQTHATCAHNNFIRSLPISQQTNILPSLERLRASADNDALPETHMHLL